MTLNNLPKTECERSNAVYLHLLIMVDIELYKDDRV